MIAARKAGLAAMVVMLGLASPAFAASGEMSVATFLAKADALVAKGFMALASSDIGLLKSEGGSAAAAYRARLDQERGAGHPSSCPPRSATVGQTQLLSHLRSYPAAVRAGTTMRTAFADYFIKTYPCR